MIDAHTAGSSDTLYELGRIVLFFGLIGAGTWIVIKLMLGSAKQGSTDKGRRITALKRAKIKGKHRR